MKDDEFTYVVKCHTCYAKFKVQLFESHEKNLFLVDKRDWYCDKCKKAYFNRQTEELSKAHQDIGLPVLTGTDKMVSWGEKIRAELVNKVNYLKQSLSFESEDDRQRSDVAFASFFKEWQKQETAKWWIDNRRMTVMDISKQVKKLGDDLEGDG